MRRVGRVAVLAALLLVRATSADVLPDDRADLFYSKYSGGGMDITGESVLVRKKITENFAVEANYFVDKVSGASIDVLSQASQIKDDAQTKERHRRVRPRQDHLLAHRTSTASSGITNPTPRAFR